MNQGRNTMKRLLTVAAALMAFGAGPLAAQMNGGPHDGENADRPTVGTVLIAHGGSDAWNQRVFDLAATVETRGPLAVSLLMGGDATEYRFQDVVANLVDEGAEEIVVVPLFASSHSGHFNQIRYLTGMLDDAGETMMHHLRMKSIHRPEVVVPIRLTPALDASMEIATVLSRRALDLADDPAEQALFIIGHGPNAAEDYGQWMANLRPVADSVARATGFRDVRLGMVRDDAPAPVRVEAVTRIREIIAMQHEMTGRPVVVVPVLVSKGYLSTQDLPNDLEGLTITYDGEGLLPHTAIAEWVERRVRESGTVLVENVEVGEQEALHTEGHRHGSPGHE